jgi:fumarylacetoacetase
VTWIPVPEGSPFPATNLPYGVLAGGVPVVAIGDQVLDLCGLASAGLIDGDFSGTTLDAFLAAGPATWAAVRAALVDLVTDESHRAAVEPHLQPRAGTSNVLPFTVADYVDFYSSIDHAKNLGAMFRPGQPALTPNWKHLPIGYHGRAGTVVVSGTDVRRPVGQRAPAEGGRPPVGPSVRLDIEAEVGFVVGVPAPSGRVPASALADHVLGMVLVNDWSARDIQAWEYVPLGPFLGKSFATSVSPWIVPLEALRGARIDPVVQDPEPVDYLHDGDPWQLDVTLEVSINGHLVSRPPFGTMYWTPGQQLAHLTVNGASLRTGDLFASGTISGPSRDQRGSFIELSWNGTEPLTLPDGSVRTFLEDGDTVSITAWATLRDGSRLGFGEVVGTIVAAEI